MDELQPEGGPIAEESNMELEQQNTPAPPPTATTARTEDSSEHQLQRIVECEPLQQQSAKARIESAREFFRLEECKSRSKSSPTSCNPPNSTSFTTRNATKRNSSTCQDDEAAREMNMELVGRYLETHPREAETWLCEHASPELQARLVTLLQAGAQPKKSSSSSLFQDQQESFLGRNRRDSITADLLQSWLAVNSPIKRSRSPSRSSINKLRQEDLSKLDKNELFMELIRDIANELDMDQLCHKILVNVELLTQADRGSLFLVKGSQENRYLVAKLFDVTRDMDIEEALEARKRSEVRIPFGVGIAGHVAQTKEIINIKNAYEDPRFHSEIDMRTGYKTQLILSVPICNYEGDVIGVAQIINKTNDSSEFSDADVELFQRYLTFCGIGIQNAQLFELSVMEYRRNQILLNLASNIFEEQNNLECLVTKIMKEAKELLKCERCAVYLLDLDCGEAGHLEKIVERPGKQVQELRKPLSRRESNNIDMEDILQQHGITSDSSKFTVVFEMMNGVEEARIYRPTSANLVSPLVQIASYVAATSQVLNIADVASWSKRQVFQVGSEPIRSILCMPIVNGQHHVIGVAQLINKDNGFSFTDSDVSIFEAFAIFCGLGIHNTQMYESACKLMAKQKVALECLSYHATANNDDAHKLMSDEIRTAEDYNLYSFKFIDFDLTDEDTCRAALRMFKQCDLVNKFQVPYDVLCRWVLSVKKNYRPVKYHNWRHALNVAQAMFAMLKTGKMEQFMQDIEILGLLVACLCHDLDHRGTNNSFQTKTESPLAILYSTSTMEHHHFDQCVMILNSDSNNIFQNLSMEDYRKVMRVVENAILSTDLAVYTQKKNKFKQLIDDGEFDWQSAEKKELLCGMMMTACDVSAIAKPWEIQHRIAKLVADEFFDQGDLERLQLNQQPVAMMDRERCDELPQMQVDFIDLICLPLYKIMTETFPWIQPLHDGTLENRTHWEHLAEQVKIGLTWIDRDTIENPVEEFPRDEPKDIEFVLQTLNCKDAGATATGDADGAHHHQEAEKPSVLNRIASLRKGGKSLGRDVKSKFSRSFYGKSASEDGQGKPQQQQQHQNQQQNQQQTPTGKPESKGRNKLCILI